MAANIESLTLDVKGLFGLYDYTLTATSAEPLILTGPNGYGKTTLLTIIKNLKSGNILYFLTLPFSRIQISVNNTLMLTVTSNTGHKDSDNPDDEEDEEESEKTIIFESGDTPADRLELSTDILEKTMRPWQWRDLHEAGRRPEEISEYEAAILLESHSEEVLKLLMRKQKSNLGLIFAALPDVSFVQANRLNHSMSGDEPESATNARRNQTEEIVNISRHLKSLLEKEYRQFLSTSQKSDKDFIRNILSQDKGISQEIYSDLSVQIEEVSSGLSRFGLAEEIKMPAYNEEKSFILRSYALELAKSINCYKLLLNKLSLFSKLINAKKLAGKRISIHREHGLRMVSTSDRSFIEIERLSSGEKNQLILLYDLIFRVPDDSVLLIDEPELSLHVAWQMDFLDDLKKIASQKRLKVIIATHSPHIVADHWNLCYDLFEVSNPTADE